jgi:ribosomal protein L11 methyltransferase
MKSSQDEAAWRVLTVLVPAALEDDVAAVLGGGSLGVEIASAGAGASALRVYLGPADDADAWKRRAAEVLEAHGLPVEDGALTVSPVPDGRWVERWQKSLAPIPLGERFVVLPNGPDPRAGSREAIVLIPGMAFGTGEHPTTRMCAAAVEAHMRPGDRVLDLGTGTGILAVVAQRCGAGRVLALDIDPEAAHVASEVVEANGAAATVSVRAGSIADRNDETFDGLVANIQSSFFLANAAEVAAALRPDGWLAVSGILDDDVSEVADALAAAGIDLVARRADGPWACIVGRRRGA